MVLRVDERDPSQIETRAQRERVVLLGASDLSLMPPRVVTTLRATFAAPLEIVGAKGPGRSYGQESKIFWEKISGILQCRLWPALQGQSCARTRAIVSDVGNDLAYEAPVERIVAWIESVLDELAVHDADVVLNNIPIGALGTVGASRYVLLRTCCFPFAAYHGLTCSAAQSALATPYSGLQRREIYRFSREKPNGMALIWFICDAADAARSSVT